ncbi:hypothetical protein SAMN05518672_103134 [Chitinophaga sp. CF118]|uniref:hypothetical protein n=1 Tax=Chitinophaga sp. CF118 TaxID=1884367 RepID=UPI0008F2BED9|nr:hypothetical protein [Chitinophaga sp. CF118]SFD76624.1 hypothetical protein SAMN05518672_103134 [Chitinophaga sp. CF118]
MIKKVVIHAENSAKAAAFFEELSRKKEATRKKIEEKTAHLKERFKKNGISK